MQDPSSRLSVLVLDEDEEAMTLVVLLDGSDGIRACITEMAVHAPDVIHGGKRVVTFVLEPCEQGVVRYWS